MTTFDKLSTSQKLRAALHRDVRAICTETCHFLGLEVTKPAMEVIAELIYKKLSVYGTDLEAFAKHAKRTTINSEDVKLLVRRNPSLKSHLNAIVPTNQVAPKEKRRKTVALPVAKQPDTPPITKESDLTKTNEPALTKNKKSELTKPKESDLIKTKAPDLTDPKEIGKDKITERRTSEEDVVENMIVDDTIDLTFD